MLFRVLIAALLTVLLSGCVPGYTFAPGRYSQYMDVSAEGFARDRKACGGEGGFYTVPLILMPVLAAAMLVDRENTRRCMEKRGWRVIEKPPTDPVPDHAAALP